MERKFIAKDGHNLNVYCWDEVENPKAVLQIFHGMGEHAGRYERLANFLNSKGIAVYGDDHRGHGKTASFNGKLGVIGKNGFYNIVEDEHMITRMLREKYPNVPLYVFAHSFGSFIGQDFITKYSNEIDGIILCGTAAQLGAEFRYAKHLAFVQMNLFGEEKPARLLHKLGFGNYNKKIDISDKSNWLSRDPEEVMKYDNDPACGFICSFGFYYYFMDGLVKLYRKDKLDNIRKNLPIYIIAGQEDPVGQYGKRVNKLFDIYREQNISDLNIKLYKDCRHELLNELNRDEVTNDILKWINEHLAKS